MSLFGDEDAAGSRPKASLFDDDNTQKTERPSTSSMFADSSSSAADNNDANSPWGFTPKKSAGRGNPVKTLLANADVPDLYIDTFDAAAQGNSRVDAQHCRQLLRESRVNPSDQSQIWKIVAGGADVAALDRGEFNVLLALIGLAQEGEELGLDAVDDRRTRLPVPQLSSLVQHTGSRPVAAASQTSSPAQPQRAQQQQQQQPRKPSFGAGFREESDPWGSPALHKNHNHPPENNNGQVVENGTGRRTTSSYTTNTISESSENLAGSNYGAGPTAGHTESTSWGASTSFGADSDNFGSTITTPGGGFGDHQVDGPSSTPRRPAQPRVVTGKGVEEIITVNLLGEKEGLFLFQHRNYEVASVRRNSKVIRRYSDFVWLLECLHKRYPVRQLPLLPPKRVAINGNHIVADTLFIEKRRRGLARFANALVRHPVLREEQLVIMFLTVPTELSVWRKQATISVQEEFLGKALPHDLEDSLPQDLTTTFDTVQSGVRRSAELYIHLCNLIERVCKRKEGLAVEYGRLNVNLLSIAETSADVYAIDRNDVPMLNDGLTSVARHLASSQTLLDNEARGWDEGVLEDLKIVRDGLVSLRELFDRWSRLKDNIPQLEKRILQNEQKLQTIKLKGDAAKPGEAEKVENAIVTDKQSIVDQHARGVFVKECLRDELLFFHGSQFHVGRLHQDWANERVRATELQLENFRALADTVESMPQGD